ncbi:MAG: ribonuclease domain-containing protein [Lachnospiraceae bacterium]|nr:ribonuclease domain-containing protein [Lachnospiraceae bacterium]
MMRCGKKAGRILSAVLLVMLCVLTGVFSGCDEASLQELYSLIETDASYTEADSVYDQADSDQESDSIYDQAGSDQESESTYDQTDDDAESEILTESAEDAVVEDGIYTSPEQVALYLHLYGHLPSNYITKKDAEAAGWDSSKGNLWDVADGMSIGGSRFGNYEGELPDREGRRWYECDVNYEGGYRGAERLLYSNDGLIYYTGDHYKTFKQLY